MNEEALVKDATKPEQSAWRSNVMIDEIAGEFHGHGGQGRRMPWKSSSRKK